MHIPKNLRKTIFGHIVWKRRSIQTSLRVWHVQHSKSLWTCCRPHIDRTKHQHSMSYRNAKFKPWAELLFQSHCWLGWTCNWIPRPQSNLSRREPEWFSDARTPKWFTQWRKWRRNTQNQFQTHNQFPISMAHDWNTQTASVFRPKIIADATATPTPQRIQNDSKISNFLLQMFEQKQRMRKNRTNGRPVRMVHTEYWVAPIKDEEILFKKIPRALSLGFRSLCFRWLHFLTICFFRRITGFHLIYPKTQ